MNRLTDPERLTYKTPRLKRLLGHATEHRVEVTDIRQYIDADRPYNITLYLKSRDQWRIEDSATQFCSN